VPWSKPRSSYWLRVRFLNRGAAEWGAEERGLGHGHNDAPVPAGKLVGARLQEVELWIGSGW
jgi:hypothetical protein